MTKIPDEEVLAYSIDDAVVRTPVSRSDLYRAMKRGDLKAKKSGRRTLILRDDLAAYLAQLPDYRVAA